MRSYFLCLLFILSSLSVLGQTSPTSNSMYLELGGSAGVWSINWEKAIREIKTPGFSLRIGLGSLPIDKNNGILFTFPLAIRYVQGKKHKVEGFFGHNISLTTKGQFFGQLTPGFAYRYEATSKKVFYRLAYTPLLSYLVDFQYQHWISVSIGIKLAKK